MNQDFEHIIDLSLANFRGDIAKDQQQELLAWINASEENATCFRKMREVWIAVQAESATSVYDARRAYSRFRRTVMQREGAEQRRRSWTWGFAFAVVVSAIVLGASFFTYRFASDRLKDSFAEITVESPSGSRTIVILPDSTEVCMNGGSRIRYSQGFGVDDRTLHMSGECHFKVKHDEDIPFIVRTKELNVKVLGTVFNFRDYPEDDEIIVSLEEGRVSMRNLLRDSQERYLSPDQKCILDRHSGEMRIEKTDASSISRWIDGTLFFDEERLADLVKILSRHFGVEITISDESKAGIRFYGEFSISDGLEGILDKLSSTEKFHYRRVSGGYDIH